MMMTLLSIFGTDVSCLFMFKGVNATVTEVRCDDLIFWLVQATETFYASVDDPYIQGKISCADLLGNLYSLGITGIDSILILMNIASNLSEKERDVVVPFIFRGFQVLLQMSC